MLTWPFFKYLYYSSTNANSRNFAAQLHWIRRVIEKFLLFFRILGKIVFTEMIRRTINKELPNGNRETKWFILPGSLPAFLFLSLRDFWSVQQDTRNICVTCIFHGVNGFPVTIVNIGGSIQTVPTKRPRISKTFYEHFHPPRQGSRRVDEKDRGRAGRKLEVSRSH